MKLYLDELLGVKDNEVFACGGYFYRVKNGLSLEIKMLDGWGNCTHLEAIEVYNNRDKIQVVKEM